MAQPDLLNVVAERLQRLNIEFMLTGSHASSLQGEARATHDIDLVVRMIGNDVDRVWQAFNVSGFYLSKSAMVEAVQTSRMFNLLESSTGEKVDFWILTESRFDQSRFARRLRIDIGELAIDVSSPEDTILMKLLWCKKSGISDKQLHDVIGVYELQSAFLDQAYLKRWIAELNVEDLWLRVLQESNPYIPPIADSSDDAPPPMENMS